ncbi:MAG: serine/threonine-protein kinase [Sandaracinaceae bacterium]
MSGAPTVRASTEPALELPSQLGRYERLGEIARGGMASVHLGRVRAAGGFERIVAIKCCHPHLSGDPEFVAMFLDEARIAASIHHPNVVATLDVGTEGAVLYHVMEYIEGQRLADVLKLEAAAPVPIVARMMIDVLHGLHAAHEIVDPSGLPLDVVHRDVSPQNVMVGTDGSSRIMDFGIARAAARTTVTEQGVVKGKFAYMSPEQLMGQPVDRRCDVFAAGVVLWEALTGRRLFQGSSQGETVNRVLHVPVVPPSRYRPEAAALDAVVQRALTRSLDGRYPTALAFAEALEAATEVAKASEVAALLRDTGASDEVEKRRIAAMRTPSGLTPPTQDTLRDAVPIPTDAPSESSIMRRTPPGSRVPSRGPWIAVAIVSALIAVGAVLSAVVAPRLGSDEAAPAPNADAPNADAPNVDAPDVDAPDVDAPAPPPAAAAIEEPDRAPTPAIDPSDPGAAETATREEETDAPAGDDGASAPESRGRRRRRGGRPSSDRPPDRTGGSGGEYLPRAL